MVCSRICAERCIAKFGYCRNYRLSSVCQTICRLLREYCDKTTEGRIMQFSLKSGTIPQLLDRYVKRKKLKGISLTEELKLGRKGWFWTLWRYRLISETVRATA